jgi:4'-phosphopantetheinyl transferase EntD
MNCYTVAFQHASPHGVLAAVHIPDSPDPVPEEILARLPAAEADHARSLRGYRQVQFVGGRIALRRACEQLGVRPTPILSTDRGAPLVPAGLAGSVSHKRTLAVGMVASSRDGTLGVDLEDYGPPRPSIARHILTPAELAAVEALPEDRRWTAILQRFSIKEAIYKAVDPYVRRYVGFHEAMVWPDLQKTARVELCLANGEGPFAVDARYDWLHGRLVTSVRIQPAVA